MRVLVTGSAGHLGEALMRALPAEGCECVGVDILPSPYTTVVGSIADRDVARRCVEGVDAVLHTATLHKPHVGSHRRRDFVDVNVTGTLNLLEAAVEAGVAGFVFTSTTSTFGRALVPADGEPAAWITEDVVPVPQNVYGATKVAAEDLCELVHRDHGLPVLVLRTSRFFPEADDRDDVRDGVRRREPQGQRAALPAGRPAGRRRPRTGSRSTAPARSASAATSSARRRRSRPRDLGELRRDAPAGRRAARARATRRRYEALGWRMLPSIERVYVNDRARRELGWAPRYDFAHALELLGAGEDFRSPLAREVGAKGYHAETTGVYTTRA